MPSSTSNAHGDGCRCTTGLRWGLVVLLLSLFWGMAVGSWSGWSLWPIKAAEPEKCVTYDEMAHMLAGYSHWATGSIRLQPENGILPQRWVAIPLVLDSQVTPPAFEGPLWETSQVWPLGSEFFYAGDNDVPRMLLASRMMMATFSLAIGLLVFLWSKKLFGWVGGLTSLILFTFCPLMLSHSALATSDAFATFFFLALVGAWWRQQQRLTLGRWLVSGLAAGGLALSKFSSPIAVFMILVMMAVGLFSASPIRVSLAGWSATVAKRWQRLTVWSVSGLTQLLLVTLLIWAAYGFRFSPFPQGSQETYSERWVLSVQSPGPIDHAIRIMREHRLLPEAYLYGQAFVIHHAQARSAYLNGQYDIHGWWWYFPFSMLIKTPLAVFAILSLAFAAVARRWRQVATSVNGPPWQAIRESLRRTAPLWVLIAVYMAFALTSHLNIGVRHVMPVYPALYILAGAVGLWFVQRNKIAMVLAGLGVIWLVHASLAIHPHYLAYFNSLVGGPSQGYRHLADSSIDWGQDLPGLRKWIADRGLDPKKSPATSPASTGTGEPVYLAYFGTGNPADERLPVKLLPGAGVADDVPMPDMPLTGGYYAISVSMVTGTYVSPPGAWSPDHEVRWIQLRSRWQQLAELMGDEQAARQVLSTPERQQQAAMLRRAYGQARIARLCSYLRSREPTDQVGYSINIYRLTEQEVEQALNAPPPELIRARQEIEEKWRNARE